MTATTMLSTIVTSADLMELNQWVLWKRENGTKVPYTTHGKKASSTDPKTWASFDEVIQLWQRRPNLYAGPGFVFVKGLVGIDLDDCLDEHGNAKAWAQGLVEKFSDTYMEISPSGHGIKIWCKGTLPENVAKIAIHDGGIECYDHARYFTVTGRLFRGAPLQIEDHAKDVLALYDRLTAGRKGWLLQPLRGGQIPHGRQHSTLVSLCGTLRARGVCEAAIEACLQIVNEKQCERPGPREHISQIVVSSQKWGRR